jgi:hypothetical protein
VIQIGGFVQSNKQQAKHLVYQKVMQQLVFRMSTTMANEPKKQEPEIMPPVPQKEPERSVPEIPPDKEIPQKITPKRAI